MAIRGSHIVQCGNKIPHRQLLQRAYRRGKSGFQKMTRYYFRITNGKPHEDDVGEELRGDREAWLSAKRLARDIEDTLEPDGTWTVEVHDADGPLYSIGITGRKLR